MPSSPNEKAYRSPDLSRHGYRDIPRSQRKKSAKGHSDGETQSLRSQAANLVPKGKQREKKGEKREGKGKLFSGRVRQAWCSSGSVYIPKVLTVGTDVAEEVP